MRVARCERVQTLIFLHAAVPRDPSRPQLHTSRRRSDAQGRVSITSLHQVDPATSTEKRPSGIAMVIIITVSSWDAWRSVVLWIRLSHRYCTWAAVFSLRSWRAMDPAEGGSLLRFDDGVVSGRRLLDPSPLRSDR